MMSGAGRAPKVICPSESLSERGSYGFRVLYRGKASAAILVRFRGEAYGYLNQCVHMGRTLDCEHTDLFEGTGDYMRCSMHGVTYDPATGLCKSAICEGKSLTSLKIQEREGFIYLEDKRGRLPD